MKIAILDDYQDCVRSLACFARLAGHEVIVLNQTFSDPAELAARLWRGADQPQPLLTSFAPQALQAARDAAPQLPRGLLLDALTADWPTTARALGCVAVICNHALWDAALVAQVHGMGMRCLSYTVNDECFAQRLIVLGTDGIVTDRVDLFAPG